MSDTAQGLYAALGATWPPAAAQTLGPFTIRDGQGGGKRVCAATAEQPVTAADLPMAEAAMQALGQAPLFMIRKGDAALDALLAERGYGILEPVNFYMAPAPALACPPPPLSTFTVWEPLAIQRAIWQAGGIGPARLAIMACAPAPKTALFGCSRGHPAAAGFVGLHAGTAMVHAVEVLAPHRRESMGQRLMHQAALWAVKNGASHIAAACTQANAPANALYASLGMAVVGHYHYRQRGIA